MKHNQPSVEGAARHQRGNRSRQLRIVGGKWRGRRWQFPLSGIRPTPDRVRETLFNWLQSRMIGARTLDLFAGSGALGLEALSRGAAEAVFIEREPRAAAALRGLLAEWQATGAEVECIDAEQFVARPGRHFDLVFLDPPYTAGLLAPIAARLHRGDWLAPQALIYLERGRREPLPPMPATWTELKTGQAGEVGYHLFECPSSMESSL